MNSRQLNYCIHDEPDALRFALAGSLSGDDAESVFQAWQTSLSIIGSRPLIIDITLVVDVDELGCAVLDTWHRSGARIITASPESQALAEAVLGERVRGKFIPVARPKQGWLQRLHGFVLGCPTVGPLAPIGGRTRHSSQKSQPECRQCFPPTADPLVLSARLPESSSPAESGAASRQIRRIAIRSKSLGRITWTMPPGGRALW